MIRVMNGMRLRGKEKSHAGLARVRELKGVGRSFMARLGYPKRILNNGPKGVGKCSDVTHIT
jgi:hypothetical protein